MVNGALFRGAETLRAGEYSLYVFTDGEAVTISLDLPRLTGGANVHVGRPGAADVHTPTVAVDPRDDVTAYSANASYEMKGQAGIFMSVNVMRDESYRDASFDECLSPDHVVPDDIERTYCAPTGGGIIFVRPLDPAKLHPKRGGFILITFVGLTDLPDDLFNGDSSLHHYSFRVLSPGSMAELWSQGALLSF